MNHITEQLCWAAGLIVSLLLTPLLPGIINKTKAFFAGRKGPRLLQMYYDIAKLLKRGSIRSTTSGGLVRMAPVLNLAVLLAALIFIPFANSISPFAFTGDVMLFLYLLGFGRIITVLGALDTGSAFEGMGASREVQFSALAEAATLMICAFLAVLTSSFSLGGMLLNTLNGPWIAGNAALIFAAFAMLIVLLTENCRVPFDDPETHLELTMIHEAMILDNGGPDLALIHYSAALKLWIFSILLVNMLLPGAISPAASLLIQPAGVLLVGIVTGIIESTTARYRFLKVPQMLLTALAFAALALSLLPVFGKVVK